jgi:dTDP-glucose 4,6-dehydratase
VKVLLTGIAGFIGSHIVEHLQVNTDWQIVGLASFRHFGDALRTDPFDPARVTILHADLTAPISPRQAERIGPVDYIINAAADSHVDRSIDEPRPFIENNVAVAISMLEYARVAKPKVFLQVSTDEVYGPAVGDQLSREWDAIVPSNPYSASKAAQEAIAIAYWRTYGVPLAITNTMNNYGERQDPEKYISKLITRINAGEVVTVHGAPGRIGSRFYLHARNHADALLTILKREPAMWDGEAGRPDRYNVVGDTEIDNLELARLIAELLGKPLHHELVDFHTARPGHDRRYALDGSKLRDLGWRPPVPFRESLERTIAWTLDHPEWLA